MRINDILVEFAAGGSGDSGNYFQALASAWYNGTFDTGSLEKGIKSQQDVEQLLNRGIVAPDGKIRKYGIDYNSDFDGVVISSDDYYEHADLDDTDSRTGKPFGPYDYMEFGDEELDESAKYRDAKYKDQLYTQEPPDYNDTREYDNARFNPKPKGYPGRKELPGGGEYDRTDPLVRGAGIGRSGIKNNILDRGKRKGLPSRDQITSLKQSIKDISGRHTRANLPKESVNEFAADDGDNGGEDDALHNYAKMWWTGDEATQMQIEKVLARMGWEIGEDEGGYDNGGVFVVRAGDVNGNSYVSWAAEDLTEGAPISGDGGAVDNFRQQMANRTELAYQKDMAEGNRKSEPPEADYGDDYQDMVKRVKKLAGVGPLKTQYDPNNRVYKNMPTAAQPKK
jgi:hypothetical protein